MLDNAEALREPDDLAAALDADAAAARAAWDALPAVGRKFGIAHGRRGPQARDAGGAHREDRGGCRGRKAPVTSSVSERLILAIVIAVGRAVAR